MAIISHPDAGKTTLTEKLLLYGGAIHLAGSVKARRAARHVTSDWMELERQRGISVTSSVMAFDYDGYRINLLDTPGHQDFSEDTYRTLVAADSAVMLLDNRKGVEERTRQLFAVCKRRRMPIFTFVNKCDRAGENPLKLLSDVEAELGIDCYPVTWPVFASSGFAGVYDRRTKKVTLFERTEDHGASIADTLVYDMDAPELLEIVGADGIAQLAEEVSLLDEAGHQWSHESLLDGSMTPVHFGSALTNFGVEAFLQDFLEAGALAHRARIEHRPDRAHPHRVHRLRVQDPGEHGPAASRSHRLRAPLLRPLRARHRGGACPHRQDDPPLGGAAAHGTGAQQRRGSVGGRRDRRHRPRRPSHRRHALTGGRSRVPGHPAVPARAFRAGVSRPIRCDGSTSTPVFASSPRRARRRCTTSTARLGPTPIVGAVGQLQFDVMMFRLQNEYGAPCRIEPIGFRFPRWVVGPTAAIDRAAAVGGRLRLYDTNNHPVMIFENEWSLRTVQEFEKGLQFLEVAP